MSKFLFLLASLSTSLGLILALKNMTRAAYDPLSQLTGYANMPFELAIALFAGAAAAELIWGEPKA